MADESRMKLKIGRDWSGGREIMGMRRTSGKRWPWAAMGKVWAVADDLGPRRAFIKMEEEGNEVGHGRVRFVFGITQAWMGSRWVIMSLFFRNIV